jgi:hypothetical protein
MNEDNDKLIEPFVSDEFKDAIFSIQVDKCPGSDGFNPGFYQHFRDILRTMGFSHKWISLIMLCVETID